MADSTDPRPPLWTGHVHLFTANLDAATHFLERLGMRKVGGLPKLAALELRGGTHLVLREDPEQVSAGVVPWDLMVDDLEATHDLWQADGFDVSSIVKSSSGPHRSFELTDAEGHVFVVRDSHVAGPV
jgi:catechol 2,3-dioxygenase-like lactoylglutathione lyase family enzyme